MAVFEIQGPDGKTYEIDAPDQVSAVQAFKGFSGVDAPKPGLGDILYENIIGRGDVDTPGERIGAAIGQAGRGAVEGAAGLVDLLTAPARSAGANIRHMAREGIMTPDPAPGAGMDALYGPAQKLAEPVTSVQPETTGQEFARTVGEFIPGALAFGGGTPGALAKFGVLPGVASEASGQMTEGTAAEPYARTIAAMAAPTLASALTKPTTFSAALPGADPERIRQANILAQRGVTPSAGQATGIEALRRAEGSLAATGGQLDDFTAAAMKSIGSTSRRATPEALKAAEKAIVQSMDDAVSGVSVRFGPQQGAAAQRVASDYVARVPVGNLTPRIRGIADEIMDIATDPAARPVSLAKLREWRTDIGKFTVSSDGPTREAAHSLRNLIDGVTDGALKAAGRADDVAALSAGREQYRNLIAIKDVASRSGDAAAVGVVSPARLQSAVTRTQGRGQYATGGGTGLAPLARAGEAVLASAPTVSPGAVRSISHLAPAGLGAMGYYAGGGSVPLGLAAASAPTLGRAMLRSGPMQRLMADPMAALSSAMGGIGVMSPGLYQGMQ